MTSPRPIAVQLYTLRELLKSDFEGTVAKVAELGYDGVEPFNMPDLNAGEQARVIRQHGLAIPSAHLPMPVGNDTHNVIQAAQTLGVETIVSGIGPEGFADAQTTARSLELFNEAASAAREAGFRFAIHNHWWEFEGEPPPWRLLHEKLDPGAGFELDTYWVAAAGVDPVKVLSGLGERVWLAHMKDGSAKRGDPMTALGQGTLDIPAIAAAAAHAAWLIVELDECATDMLSAVDESLSFLRRVEAERVAGL